MASIKFKRLRMVVYAADHPPPHAHVFGPGWEIRVALTAPPSLMTIAGPAKKADVRSALVAVFQNLDKLRNFWRVAHD